jgi:succinate dehydrogenase flavin-adding protein (antitoxin of CptAB toxin-antitoxin module)
MRELDVLLTRYLEQRFDGASPAAQRAFIELLEAPDPLIHAYCIGQAHPPTAIMSAVIERITSNALD